MKKWDMIIKRERVVRVEAETRKKAFIKAIEELEPGEIVVCATEIK